MAKHLEVNDQEEGKAGAWILIWATMMLPFVITFQSFKNKRFVIRVVSRQMVPSHSLFFHSQSRALWQRSIIIL